MSPDPRAERHERRRQRKAKEARKLLLRKVAVGAAVAVGFLAVVLAINYTPLSATRRELEREAGEWREKGGVQAQEKDAYTDFCARYRQEFGRDWNAVK